MEFHIFSKQIYKQIWNNRVCIDQEKYYINCIPALISFIEEQRKTPNVGYSLFDDFFQRLENRPDKCDEIILSRDHLINALNDSGFREKYLNKGSNPYELSARIGNMCSDNLWWNSEDVEESIKEFFG